MNFFKRIFCKKNPTIKEENSTDTNRSKDPSDYKKDDLSTDWIGDNRHCNECKKSTTHNEYMSDICNSCGNFNTQIRFGRSYRKIYIDGKWKYQVRYRNGEEEIRDEWY